MNRNKCVYSEHLCYWMLTIYLRKKIRQPILHTEQQVWA